MTARAAAAVLSFCSVAAASEAGIVELGRGRARVTLRLEQGALEARDAAGRVVYRSGADEDVLGFAAAPLMRCDRPELLVWLVRRDANERGVVPHASGWMSYRGGAWLNPHLALLAWEERRLAPEWVSSGLQGPIEAMWTEPGAPGACATVELRGAEGVESYRFQGWQLERVASPAGVHARPDFDTGLADVLAVGDVMVGRETGRLLDLHGYGEAFAGVLPLFRRADLRLGNLEGCFREVEPAMPAAFDLFAPRRHLAALRELSFDALNLANNHCASADARFSAGVLSTAGISAVGVGTEEHHLGSTAAFRAHGLRVAVAGLRALPSDEREARAWMTPAVAGELAALSRGADEVLVLVHWGEEYATAPTAAQRTLGHWLVDHGASAVLGQHPHVAQEVEDYGGHPIAYSLGNFVFDQEGYPTGTSGATERGLALELRLHRRLGVTWRDIPLRIEERHRVVRSSGADGSNPAR